VKNKARRWVIAALEEISKIMPFPIIGVDSDNGSEFINHHLLDWCAQRKITFTRSRPGNSNDGAHIEQKNWAIVRTVVGYHRYDTAAELSLLNQIYALVRLHVNFFSPQQKLISKTRDGAKVIKKYDPATTPNRRGHRPRRRRHRGQDHPRRHLRRAEPSRHPTQHPSPHQPATEDHHQQGPTRREALSSSRNHARIRS
jgi:hypothetical protein